MLEAGSFLRLFQLGRQSVIFQNKLKLNLIKQKEINENEEFACYTARVFLDIVSMPIRSHSSHRNRHDRAFNEDAYPNEYHGANRNSSTNRYTSNG